MNCKIWKLWENLQDSFTTFIIAPVQICSDLDSLAAAVVAQRAGRS